MTDKVVIDGIEVWLHQGLMHIRTPDGKEYIFTREQAGAIGRYLLDLDKKGTAPPTKIADAEFE